MSDNSVRTDNLFHAEDVEIYLAKASESEAKGDKAVSAYYFKRAETAEKYLAEQGGVE